MYDSIVKYNRSSTGERNRGEPLTNCDECEAPLTIPSDAIQGEIVSCKDCGASYEVRKDEASGLITLKPAEKEQEDWGE
jgi:alpha-aminoadipate/glutamate carrier protein LysW